MKTNLTLFLFLSMLICQGCHSSHEIVDHFLPSYYSNEKCYAIDTIYAQVDSIYQIDANFVRLYGDFSSINVDSCSGKIYYDACHHSLSEARKNGRDSSYVLKATNLVEVIGVFPIKNVATGEYVDLFMIRVGEDLSNENQRDFANNLYPLLFRYCSYYKKQAETFTTVVSSHLFKDNYNDYIKSLKRTIMVFPDTLH